ncbi:M48 family metalloprotease [uncultured Sphingomonas sp.]|uniref:M48 family metalloprotease n=1 Tax=uncultured Sphingomonas sp. TaxID=158754 RepID=UPI0025CD295C|nr:M48 family metalloprotease [uncultured Sphingomonas sp.]
MKRILPGLFLTAVVSTSSLAQAQSPQAARSISQSDRQQGAAANPQLTAEFGSAYKGPQTAFVERVGKRVAIESGLSNASGDFTVTLLNSPVENAFAIPGGYIYITRQLLALMNSEAELASVLGHEVGHVAARHSTSRNTRATIGSILAAGAGALTGSSLATRVVGTGAQLYTLKYGRGQEYEADALGIRYMTAAGYNPYAAAQILDQLDASTALSAQASGKSAQSLPTWASTHPNGAERVERAMRLAADTGKPDRATGQDVAFLRMLDGLPYGATNEKKVIRIVTVGTRDTVDTLAARMNYPQLKRERFLTLNGLTEDQPLRPGMLVKLVAAG